MIGFYLSLFFFLLFLIWGGFLIKRKRTGVEIEENEAGTVNIYPKGEDRVVFGFRSETEEYVAGNDEEIGDVILTQKKEILWQKDFERPKDCSVSNTGRVALINHRELCVYDRDGHKLFSKEFEPLELELSEWGKKKAEYRDSLYIESRKERVGLPEKCAISPDGKKVAVTTNVPLNGKRVAIAKAGTSSCSLYAYDLISNDEILSRELPNGCLGEVGFLKINEEVIQIIMRRVGEYEHPAIELENFTDKPLWPPGATIEDDPDFTIDIKSGRTVGGKAKRKLNELKELYRKKK